MAIQFKFDKQYLNLSDEIIERILSAIEVSSKTGKEVGFYICGTEEENFAGSTCIGGECEIGLKDCGASRAIALFHTHPGIDHSLASVDDLLHSFYKGIICCVAGTESDEVCCHKANPEKFKGTSGVLAKIDMRHQLEEHVKWLEKVGERFPQVTEDEAHQYFERYKHISQYFVTNCWKIEDLRRYKYTR